MRDDEFFLAPAIAAAAHQSVLLSDKEREREAGRLVISHFVSEKSFHESPRNIYVKVQCTVFLSRYSLVHMLDFSFSLFLSFTECACLFAHALLAIKISIRRQTKNRTAIQE